LDILIAFVGHTIFLFGLV